MPFLFSLIFLPLLTSVVYGASLFLIESNSVDPLAGKGLQNLLPESTYIVGSLGSFILGNGGSSVSTPLRIPPLKSVVIMDPHGLQGVYMEIAQDGLLEYYCYAPMGCSLHLSLSSGASRGRVLYKGEVRSLGMRPPGLSFVPFPS